MPGTEKSDGAFRTIREVADWLAVPTHVLRFWESKFDQIAPVKGAGGRRYYRPDDMKLLGGIKVMLHDQGLTVRGVGQKIDDDGIDAVMALSPDLDVAESPPQKTRRVIRPGDEEEKGQVVSFDRAADPAADAPNRPETPVKQSPTAVKPAPPKTPAQPDAPGADADPPQPTDVRMPPQPVDDDRTMSPAPPPQPEPQIEAPAAPGSDPTPVPTNERGVEAADVPAPAVSALPVLDAAQKRRLRRIVRKLRDLIAEVEDELAEGGSQG
ncbi:MerR family transcriptional regulator [Jannaschia donghaensis]|uniref:MerR family regulatory protein n=1 Tax=Jannaschia donghaensis TaxID=420998 RepID=A0A0M6YK57_9RHOB|nr:MerR family transcriptional regulator [Jannaschia donghaensis]CTQ50294.1 MerR family regulatory protein [Jannaschia donghaensis]